MIFTLFIYNLALALNIFFAVCSEKIKSSSNHILIVLSFLVVFLFVGLRYNVGNDYEAYTYLYNAIRGGVNTHVEYGYYALNKVFSYNLDGYKYVMIVSSFITFLFLYMTLIRDKILSLGLFFVFTFEFLFLINDQVRQGVAISIFLFSIYYIEKRYFYKYLIFIISAALLFHYSALLLIPAYFIYRKKIASWIWFVAIIVSFIFYLKGFFQKILINLIAFIPYYGERYVKYSKFVTPEELGSGMAVLFWVLLALFIAYKQHKIERPVLINLYLFGMVFYLIFLDFHLLSRAAAYMFYIKILIFPLYLSVEKNMFFKITILVIALLFFELEVFLDLGKHGGFPYQTIFSK